MTRNKLRSETCLLRKVEPMTMSEALQDNDWYNAMKEEIEKIEKNKTWIASTSIETWYICDPIKVYQRDTKDIWFRGFQTC